MIRQNQLPDSNSEYNVTASFYVAELNIADTSFQIILTKPID